MGEELAQKKFDLESLFSIADDLVGVLKHKRDSAILTQILEGANKLHSTCHNDSSEVHTLLEDVQKKINTCKQKLDDGKRENGDAELDHLQNELDQELQREQRLRQELRVVSEQIGDLEHQRVLIEDRKEILKKVKKEVLRAQNELSMYASVTKIIPNLDDREKISGHIVERDKRIVEKFEFEPTKTPSMEICNNLWRMGNL